MITWTSLLLVGGLCMVGIRAFFTHRTQPTKRWLIYPDVEALPTDVSNGTRIYVVRSWHEDTQRDHAVVRRYALEDPVTGHRWGFPNADGLLDTLAHALTGATAAP